MSFQLCLRTVFSACFLFLISACSSAPKIEGSNVPGFLSDYSRLKPVSLASGRKSLMWVDPKITISKYTKLKFEPVVFFPQPLATKHVGRTFLNRLLAELDSRILSMAKSDGLPLTEHLGKNSLQLFSAITAVKVDIKALSVREVIPARLLFSAIEMAAGARDYQVVVNFEYKLVDSLSGEILVEGFRQGEAQSLANSEQRLKLEHVETLLDEWGMDFSAGFMELQSFL